VDFEVVFVLNYVKGKLRDSPPDFWKYKNNYVTNLLLLKGIKGTEHERWMRRNMYE
jgi:hypothetical protein